MFQGFLGFFAGCRRLSVVFAGSGVNVDALKAALCVKGGL